MDSTKKVRGAALMTVLL